MAKTQTIVIRSQEERLGAINRMADAGWKLISEEPAMGQDSTILTFEEEGDNLPTPGKQIVFTG